MNFDIQIKLSKIEVTKFIYYLFQLLCTLQYILIFFLKVHLKFESKLLRSRKIIMNFDFQSRRKEKRQNLQIPNLFSFRKDVFISCIYFYCVSFDIFQFVSGKFIVNLKDVFISCIYFNSVGTLFVLFPESSSSI